MSAPARLPCEKVSTTPANPALGIMHGIGNFAARGIDLSAIEFFSHGTTITTNALLEMRGAKVGLLINRGFRAVQETQGQARDGNLFDYFFQKPTPIAPQSLTREIGGRVDYTGAVLEPLDEDAVREAAAELKAAGVRSIAVCYLFSFMNPAHEERQRRAHPRGVSGGAHFAVLRSAVARARMAAAVGDAAQRLSGAGAGHLHRRSGKAARARPA